MTDDPPAVGICEAEFNALVATLKASGVTPRKMNEKTGLSEDERLILAYLKLRRRSQQKTGEAGSATGGTIEENMNKEPTRSAVGVQTNVEMKTMDPPATRLVGQGFIDGSKDPGDGRRHVDASQVSPSVSHRSMEDDSGEGAEHSVEEATGAGTVSSAIGLPTLDTSTLQNEADMPAAPSGVPQIGAMPTIRPDRMSLPNARTRTPYEARIEGYNGLFMRDDGGCGLSVDEDGKVFAARMPAGEYKISMGGIKDGKPVSIIARLSVIPNPQELWVSVPSDKTDPLAKPDEAFDMVQGTAFMVAASKRGRSHAKDGTFRDDHFGLSYDADSGWHVMVVADGAGSARSSREGSKVACERALEALKKLLPEEVDPNLTEIMDVLRSTKSDADRGNNDILRPARKCLVQAAFVSALGIAERAEELEQHVADLSTTLAIAAAKRIDGQWLLLSFSVGDGGIVLWDREADDVALMCRPDSGEFAGQTRFLSADELQGDPDLKSRVFVRLRDEFTAFVAMTDGISDPKFETDAGLAAPERWRRFWDDDLTKQVEFSPTNSLIEKEFLAWMDFWSRGNHDDRTLAVMIPIPSDTATVDAIEAP